MLFKVKPKIIILREPGKLPKSKVFSTWMEENKEYPVFDTFNYREKKEDGTYRIVTLFLICDSKTGRMDWVDASHLIYVGE